MTSPPDLDPYVVLGVSKNATVSEIRAAHRKRVLKCHPDKVQDESQRIAAQDEFQRVQQAYETLSDDNRRSRYDQKARLAELKRELLEKRRRNAESSPYSSPRGSGSGAPREVREGRVFEERVPVDIILDEELRFTEEPRSMSRKYEEFGMRSKSKPTEEKKTRVPTSSHRAAKEQRETTKAKLADQAKQRDRERRRQASAKYDAYDTLAESDSGSESSGSDVYVRLKKPAYRSRESRDPRESRESRESRSRPTESARRRGGSYNDDDDDDELTAPYKLKQYLAEEHIHRSKHEVPRGSRSPQRHRGYESAEPEMNTSRRTARSSRSTRNQSSSRNNSWEDLESPRREREEFKVPKMPSSSTSPAYKSSIRPSLFGARATTSTGFTRPKRETFSRDESILDKMVREPIPRSSRRYDSGYSSPSTPEMPARGSSPKTTARYKIVDPVIIEPSKPSKYRSVSPERSRMTPKRASTFASFETESPRIEVRSVRPVRQYDDVEYTARPRAQDVKYTREIRPSDVHVSPGRSSYYNDPRHPPVGRRQSTAV